jgi:hypothetical protein
MFKFFIGALCGMVATWFVISHPNETNKAVRGMKTQSVELAQSGLDKVKEADKK